MALNHSAAPVAPARGQATQVTIATILALACLALSAFMPIALSQLLIWGACEIDCTRLGWLALEYAPWVGFFAVALMVSVLGRKSYDLFGEALGAADAPMTKRLHAGGAIVCVALMALSPYYAPDPLPQVVVNTSLRASGVGVDPQAQTAAPLPRPATQRP